jgi:hypothetical protein
MAMATAPDAAEIGRPHSWNERRTTAAVLLRQGAKGGRRLVALLKDHI